MDQQPAAGGLDGTEAETTATAQRTDGEAAAAARRTDGETTAAARRTDGETTAALPAETVAVLQDATRVLAGVALRSLEALDGAVTLPQFRLLAVLADLGTARSARVAKALGLEASTVTRLADRLVAAGHVARGSEPGHRGVVTLRLTGPGRRLVGQVAAWRERELAWILGQLTKTDQQRVTSALRQFVDAAGEGYGTVSRGLIPV